MKPEIKYIGVTHSQMKTLLYWAHVGASSERAKMYTEQFPTRKTPFQKIRTIEDDLADCGFSRY